MRLSLPHSPDDRGARWHRGRPPVEAARPGVRLYAFASHGLRKGRQMSVHYLQHVPFEGLGAIEDWCAVRGHTITATRLFAEPLPPGSKATCWSCWAGP